MKECPICEGYGNVIVSTDPAKHVECQKCDGTGEVKDE